MMLLVMIFGQALCIRHGDRTAGSTDESLRSLLQLIGQQHQLPDVDESMVVKYLKANDDVNQKFSNYWQQFHT